MLWDFYLEGEVVGFKFDYRFRIFQGSDSQWYITIEHVNGQALYTSEGYARRESAIDSLENFLLAVRYTAGTAMTEQQVVAHHTISK